MENDMMKLLESFQQGGGNVEIMNRLLSMALSMTTTQETVVSSIVRKVYEENVVYWCTKGKDMKELENALTLLRPYLFENYYKNDSFNHQRRNELVGLDLLCMMVGSRLGEFHCLLQLTSIADIKEDKNIKFVVDLENDLMEGSFNLVLDSRKLSTSPLYEWLLAQFIHTIRDEAAACMEVAYKSVSLSKAASLLKCSSKQELEDFIKHKPDWTIENNNRIVFATEEQKVGRAKIPSELLIKDNLRYAADLERIV